MSLGVFNIFFFFLIAKKGQQFISGKSGNTLLFSRTNILMIVDSTCDKHVSFYHC